MVVDELSTIMISVLRYPAAFVASVELLRTPVELSKGLHRQQIEYPRPLGVGHRQYTIQLRRRKQPLPSGRSSDLAATPAQVYHKSRCVLLTEESVDPQPL